ncbi:hypothetical protein ACFWN7_09875 [Agromyces sp. NPDC058484]|uniref:hypothetical protein n=1 Tax=Agromyces sp. NPDC058484 TaxID=3346524 RepID=UPI0036604953
MRRPPFWLIVAAALLLVAIAVVIGNALGSVRGTDPAASGTPTPSATIPDGATDTATTQPAESEAPPAEAGVVIPASCEGIYTRDWTPDFEGLVLNPAWTNEPNSGVRFGSRDEVAVHVLETTTKVTCKWGNPKGGSDRGLTTNVAVVDVAQATAMREHFETVGYSCYDELEGTRCVIETEPTPDGQSGESHFLRDDVWVATLWVNAGPDGYTHDIVTAIFG